MRYAVCVKRTTVMLPDETDARLRREARRRGVSIAELTREAIEACLPPSPRAGTPLSFFAIGAGEPHDAARDAERLVSEAIERRRRRSGRSR
jgi:hypothetical protein